MNEMLRMTVRQLNQAIRTRELGVKELVKAYLDRIARVEPQIHAFITIHPEELLEEAGKLDDRIAQGHQQILPLTGIPVAIKDNISTQGIRTTCGSRILEEYFPPFDATVTARLKQNGALILGKTNCDEFAMGSSTENSAFFPTRNPWDTGRVPGGSSGGSAACVAAWEAPLALGSDTGGSIRQPAAFCGVVGLKPTYGRVSRYGLVAFGSSLDQIGPLARTVEDAAVLLEAIAGPDPADSTCSRRTSETFSASLNKDVSGLRIGVPSGWFGAGLDRRIEEKIRLALSKLEALGCRLDEVQLSHTQYAIATYYIVAPAEASSNLARYDGVKFGYRAPGQADLETMYRETRSQGFGEEVKRRIMIGTYVLSSGYYDAYYLKASKLRTLLAEDYRAAFEKVDLIVGPTTPTLPFELGEKTEDPLQMYLSDVYTVTANLAGIPAMSLPCGFTGEGLPVGLQILAPHFEESKILQVGHALETELAIKPPQLRFPFRERT
jgi:aspartyl-tRNA(Asn)/glutamyl-tRNA(Gln) amidotransferase subunit A